MERVITILLDRLSVAHRLSGPKAILARWPLMIVIIGLLLTAGWIALLIWFPLHLVVTL